MKHAAGQAAADLLNASTLPQPLLGIVHEYAEKVKTTLNQTNICLVSYERNFWPLLKHSRIIPSTIAWQIFSAHVSSRVWLANAGSIEHFEGLARLQAMKGIEEILGTRLSMKLMNSVSVAETFLTTAENRIDEDDDQARRELEDAFNEHVNVESVRSLLESLLEQAQKTVSHVVSGERNVGYFTFMAYDGELPPYEAETAWR